MKKSEHVKVVVFCIIGATTFWFFIAFNKTYTTVFSYPINYTYNKAKFIPLSDLKSTVKISLSGQGWDLLKEYFSLDKKKIDIKLYNRLGKATIRLTQFEESVNNTFTKVTVNNILSDSINYELDYRISKIIKLDLVKDSIKLNNGFSISSDITINPEEVYITGAASILNKIDKTFYLKIDEKIDDDFDDDIDLNFPDKIICDLKEVAVAFDLSPYVEIQKKFTYEVEGNKDTSLLFSPAFLLGNYYIPENLKNQVNDSSFSITLNLNNFIFERDTSLPLTEIIKPEFVRRLVLEDTLIQITSK